MPVLAAIFSFVTVVAVFALLTRWYGSPLFRRLGLLALFGHAVAGVLVLYVLPFGWDISTFHGAAEAILSGQPTGESSTVSSFAAFQSLLYAAFGSHPIVVSIVNGLLAVILVLFVRRLAEALYPDLTEHTLLVFVAMFSPLTFLFMSIPMRDALTAFSFLLLLATVAVALTEDRHWLVLPAVPLWGGLYLLRPELALLSFLGVLAATSVKAFNRIAKRPVSVPLIAGLGGGVGLLGLALFFGRFPVSRLNGALSFRGSGGAAYLDWMRYDGILDVLLVAPVRALYFQFAPFPLHVSSTFDLLAALLLPFLVVLVVLGYLSLTSSDVDPVIATLLVTVYLGGIVGYGLIDSNFGTTVRHRIPFEFLLIVFAAPTLATVARSLRQWADEPQRHASSQDEQ